MNDSLEAARRSYAEELRSLTHMSSPALFAAFATVPRERFVGPGPWRILGLGNSGRPGRRSTARLSQRAHRPRRGKRHSQRQPSMWAHFLDQLGVRANDDVLHLGCGTGYYTAILAELAGPAGTVTAIEIDEAMAERARSRSATGHRSPSLKATAQPARLNRRRDRRQRRSHASAAVLACGLKPGGKLLFPLTPAKGPGAMTFLTRRSVDSFEARLVFGISSLHSAERAIPKSAGSSPKR